MSNQFCRTGSFLAIAALVIALSGCGGSGSSLSMPEMPVTPPSEVAASPEEFPQPPQQRPFDAAQAPVIDLKHTLHVGANAAPPASQLAPMGASDGTVVSYGKVQDGVGVGAIAAYLREHLEVGNYKTTPGLETFSVQPVVRLAQGTSAVFRDFTLRAVELINTALPYENRLLFGGDSAPPLVAVEEVPNGEIFVDFVPWKDWNNPLKPPREELVGLASASLVYHFNDDAEQWQVREMRAGRIWIDSEEILTASVFNPRKGRWEETVLDRYLDDSDRRIKHYPEQSVVAVLVHEFLHALGMANHVDSAKFPKSILNEERADYDGVTGHVLYPLDRAALQAAYSRLEPGTLSNELFEKLGPWRDTSIHIRGDIELPGRDVVFGVASSNGLAQPWAFGPKPRTDLADNLELSETVTWAGRLLGFTPVVEAVGGAADLIVKLETLDGQLAFTGLELWEANAPPGPAGTGTTWGDGDLQYLVNVRGNTFLQTGGDAGTVTGAFLGLAHEGMGGVLERSDLSAAFGGTR